MPYEKAELCPFVQTLYDDEPCELTLSSVQVFTRKVDWNLTAKRWRIDIKREELTPNNVAVLNRMSEAFPEEWRDRFATIKTRKRRIQEMLPALLTSVDDMPRPDSLPLEQWQLLNTTQKAEYVAIERAHVRRFCLMPVLDFSVAGAMDGRTGGFHVSSEQVASHCHQATSLAYCVQSKHPRYTREYVEGPTCR